MDSGELAEDVSDVVAMDPLERERLLRFRAELRASEAELRLATLNRDLAKQRFQDGVRAVVEGSGLSGPVDLNLDAGTLGPAAGAAP